MAVTLPPNRLQRAEHYCVLYAVALPGGVDLEQALAPEYWAHVGKQLRPHDVIRLIPEDGSYFAEAWVVAAGAGFAKLKILRNIPLVEDGEEAASDVDPQAFRVEWGGPHDKWRVIRQSDNEKLKFGLAAKAEAERWLVDHVAALDR